MTTPLTFKEIGGAWVAELKVQGTFGLHIERPEPAAVLLRQRTTETGDFAPMMYAPEALRHMPVIDLEIGGGEVFPKWVRIELGTEPSSAAVVSESDIEVLEPSVPLGGEIAFKVGTTNYTALEGMTWAQFCDSEYNNGGDATGWDALTMEVMGDGIYCSTGSFGGGALQNADGSDVKASDIIKDGGQYYTQGGN